MHSGFGFGKRNVEGEMILEFADALNFFVANTWFKKNEGRLITYETEISRTVIDYMLIRKNKRKLIRDVKVIRQEQCIPHHKPIICVLVLDLKEGLDKRKMEFVKRCKVWKLIDRFIYLFIHVVSSIIRNKQSKIIIVMA